jgi:hypothetical protein
MQLPRAGSRNGHTHASQQNSHCIIHDAPRIHAGFLRFPPQEHSSALRGTCRGNGASSAFFTESFHQSGCREGRQRLRNNGLRRCPRQTARGRTPQGAPGQETHPGRLPDHGTAQPGRPHCGGRGGQQGQSQRFLPARSRKFGTPVSLHQGDEAALVADVLLVRRRAHTEGSKADLKNISARNTTGSSKFRLGVIAGPEALESRGLEQALAGRVAELATSESYQQSHRRSTEVRRSQSSSSRRSSAKSRKSSKSSRHSGSSRSRKK